MGNKHHRQEKESHHRHRHHEKHHKGEIIGPQPIFTEKFEGEPMISQPIGTGNIITGNVVTTTQVPERKIIYEQDEEDIIPPYPATNTIDK